MLAFHVDFLLLKQHGSYTAVYAIACNIPYLFCWRNSYLKIRQDALYSADIAKDFYPQDIDGMAVGANRDEHYTVFGEIVNAYVIE